MVRQSSGQDKTPLLEIKDLQTGFKIGKDYYNAVEKVSFNVERRRIVGIVGESGCGKSVMSLSVMQLLPQGIGKVRGGEIKFEGRNLENLSEREMNKIRGKEISMIFQEPMTALNPVFTIGYQLEEVLLNHENITKKEVLKDVLFRSEHMEHLFTVEDLDYLAKGGRVSKASAFLGGLLNIKPILNVLTGWSLS